MKTMVSPSLLSANFIDLKSDIEMINKSEADWLHLDVMDGVFVPNISFGFPVIEAVSKVCTKPLDVHFMIQHPENYIEHPSCFILVTRNPPFISMQKLLYSSLLKTYYIGALLSTVYMS